MVHGAGQTVAQMPASVDESRHVHRQDDPLMRVGMNFLGRVVGLATDGH